MQEGARGEAEPDLLAPAADLDDIQGLDRRLGLAGQVAEGGEVVVAHQDLGGGVHGPGVQGRPDMPDLAAVEGGGRRSVEDAVEVAPLGSREAGVPALRGDLGLQHHHRLVDQVGVEGVAHGQCGPVLRKIHVHHLAGGVDPGIGATGGLQAQGLAAEGEDCALHRALDRGQVTLGLEALVGATIVLEGQAIAGHQASCVPAGRGRPRRKSAAS